MPGRSADEGLASAKAASNCRVVCGSQKAFWASPPTPFDAPVSGFYKAYLGLLVMLGLGFAAVVWVVMGAREEGDLGMGAALAPLVLYPYFLCVTWIFMAGIQNVVWNNTQLGAHRFRSTMTFRGLAFLYVTNTLAIVCTLGLFIPFATVRALRYRLECTSLLVAGSLDDIAAGQRAEIGAIGDGAADLGGIDLAL